MVTQNLNYYKNVPVQELLEEENIFNNLHYSGLREGTGFYVERHENGTKIRGRRGRDDRPQTTESKRKVFRLMRRRQCRQNSNAQDYKFFKSI